MGAEERRLSRLTRLDQHQAAFFLLCLFRLLGIEGRSHAGDGLGLEDGFERQIAVELGSSPGGASYALLCRGLTVYGVDPGEMAPIVRDFRGPHGNRFVHLHQPAAEVPRAALPRQYQWLFNDVNLAPMVALRYVERFVALSHGGLRGAVLTLKVNDDGIAAALPRLLERVRKLGGRELRVTQLPSHRSEVVAIATW